MVVFTFWDWLWLILYILVMVFSGVLFYTLGKRSESDFFLAGRGLPWWLPASSVYATHTATDTPMWMSGRRLSPRPGRDLVLVFCCLVRGQRVRFDPHFPPVSRLQPGGMADAEIQRAGQRTAARLDGRLAGLHEHDDPRLGRNGHGEGLPLRVRLAAVDRPRPLLIDLRDLRFGGRLLGRGHRRFPAGNHRFPRNTNRVCLGNLCSGRTGGHRRQTSCDGAVLAT